MFLATGSYKAGNNHTEILKMNETAGLSCVLTLPEKFPPSKVMWVPRDALGGTHRDIVATASDILYLYDLEKDLSNPN